MNKRTKSQVLEYLGRSSVFFAVLYIFKKTISLPASYKLTYAAIIMLAFVWIFLPLFNLDK